MEPPRTAKLCAVPSVGAVANRRKGVRVRVAVVVKAALVEVLVGLDAGLRVAVVVNAVLVEVLVGVDAGLRVAVVGVGVGVFEVCVAVVAGLGMILVGFPGTIWVGLVVGLAVDVVEGSEVCVDSEVIAVEVPVEVWMGLRGDIVAVKVGLSVG